MARKTIAVITARADAAEQQEILLGIAQAAFSANADVVVCSNLYNHWTDDPHLTYENVIYDLFDPTGFDGVILTPEAFRDASIPDSAVEKIRRAGLPAVVVGGTIPGFASVQSDDAGDLMRIAEHILTVHRLTRIDVLTGWAHDAFAQQRLAGVRAAMQQHGLTLTEEHIIYGDFWHDSGRALAQDYLAGARELPQAVICTNDHMAFGLCDALTAGGVRIPDDITVTGYDCSGGQSNSRMYHHPLLTSFRRDRRGMGAMAVKQLLGSDPALMEENRFVPGDTCRCGVCRAQIAEEKRIERVHRDQRMASSVTRLSSRLAMCRTLAEYTAVLQAFFHLLYEAQSLRLCLDAAWNTPEYEGREYLCCRITEKELFTPLRTDSPLGALADPEDSRPAVHYISPLCFQQRLFGFTVLSYAHPAVYEFGFRDFSKALADTLEFLRMKNDIHYLAQCQQASSLYDALTGFLNLREFRRMLEEAHMSVTLHAVKLRFAAGGEFIHGENFRSDIIALTARAVRRACTRREALCRADENTLLILCRHDSAALPQRLQVMLNHFLAGQYDERQVLISHALCHDAHQASQLDELLAAVDVQSRTEAETLAMRQRQPHYEALAALRAEVYASPQSVPDLQEASKRLCVSEGYFRAIYRQCFAVSYQQDCIFARVLKACYLLSETAMSVYAVALDCGYGDEKYFARQFRQSMGCAPVEYRKQRSSTEIKTSEARPI